MYVMAKRLDQYRRELYLTVEEFARHLGISLHTLYKAQRGEALRVTTVRRIAGRLGVHPADVTEFVVKSEDDS